MHSTTALGSYIICTDGYKQTMEYDKGEYDKKGKRQQR